MYSVHFSSPDEQRESDSAEMQKAVSRYSLPSSPGLKSLQHDERRPSCEISKHLPPKKKPFSISSLSLGSSVPSNPLGSSGASKRSKNVSWGLIYSENDEEAAIEDELVKLDEVKNDRRSNGTTRFCSQPIQGAPGRPPRRNSFTSEAIEEAIPSSLFLADDSASSIKRGNALANAGNQFRG